MPTYSFQSPDGKSYDVEAPNGATQEQAFAMLQQHIGASSKTSAAAPANPSPPERSTMDAIGDAAASAYKGVNDFGNNLGDAFAHHVASVPVGLAQLGMHGVKAVGDLAGGGKWLDQKTAEYDKFVQDREKNYQASVPDSVGSYTGATIGEVLPWVTGLGEARAVGAIPAASTIAGKVGLLGVEGAAMGASQPVINGGQSFASDKAKQVAMGAATGPALYGVGALARGAGDVIQHVTNPQAIADANIARMFGGTADAANKLQQAAKLVPGEIPTAAQALQTPEAVQAERMLRNNPASGPAFVAQDNANNAARMNVLQQIAGSDDDLANAVQARRDATAPYFKDSLSPSNPQQRYKTALGVFDTLSGQYARPDYEALMQAKGIARKVARGTLDEGQGADLLNQISVKSNKAQKVLDQAITAINKNMVDPARIITQLQELTKSGNPTVSGAARQHLDLIARNADETGMVPARALDDMRQNIGSMLASTAPQGVVGSQEAALYGPVTAKIVSTLNRAIPGYRNNLATYAKLSQPINDMQAVRGLLDPNAPGSLNTAGDTQLTAARVKQALRADDRANYGVSDDARSKIENVSASLQRRGISDAKISASGPGTAADMQAQGGLSGAIFGSNLGNKGGWLGRMGGATAGGIAGSSLGPVGAIVGAGVGGGISDAIGSLNSRIIAKTGATAADAEATASAIRRIIAKGDKKSTILEKFLFGDQPKGLAVSPTQSRNP